MLYEIKDIASYNKEENKMMLSNYDADFWKPYRDNYNYFDRLFMKKYRSWFPMDQEGDLEEVATDFTFDVKAWLMINDKRYSELYRIQTIPDDDKYSLTDNVYESENISESGEHSNTFNKGEQTDTEDLSATKGSEQIDTDATNTQGATGKTITNSVSAFNDSSFSNADKSVEADDSRQDVIDQTVVDGERTDTEDNSRTSGAREDTDSGTDSKTIERLRTGNIGVKTVVQMLGEQWETWGLMNFYDMIFHEIARELLRGC
mgnify:CR=1 FL=1